MGLHSDKKFNKWITDREDRLDEEYRRRKQKHPKPKQVLIEPILQTSIPDNCEFKGCPYPAIYKYRDGSSDSYICTHHALLLDEEAGEFDTSIRESFEDHTHIRHALDAVPISEGGDGRAHFDGFSLDGKRTDLFGWTQNRFKPNTRTERYLDAKRNTRIQVARREERQSAIFQRRTARQVRRESRLQLANQVRAERSAQREDRALIKDMRVHIRIEWLRHRRMIAAELTADKNRKYFFIQHIQAAQHLYKEWQRETWRIHSLARYFMKGIQSEWAQRREDVKPKKWGNVVDTFMTLKIGESIPVYPSGMEAKKFRTGLYTAITARRGSFKPSIKMVDHLNWEVKAMGYW